MSLLGDPRQLEDLRDLTLAISRDVIDDRALVSFTDVLAAFDLTEEELDAAEDLN